MCHYTVYCTGTACFNHRSIISVLPNAVKVPQLGYNAISTFNHQIVCNMVMIFYLCLQNSRKVTPF